MNLELCVVECRLRRTVASSISFGKCLSTLPPISILKLITLGSVILRTPKYCLSQGGSTTDCTVWPIVKCCATPIRAYVTTYRQCTVLVHAAQHHVNNSFCLHFTLITSKGHFRFKKIGLELLHSSCIYFIIIIGT